MDVEDILTKPGKKKIKSGKKGKRTELDLVKELNLRFSKILSENSGYFSRSVGSGNRWGQRVRLSKSARETYSGDITCPEKFKFVIESKGGYNDIDLNSAFENGVKEIDQFLEQVSDDSKRCGRKPMLVWKKDRKPRLAFLRKEDLPSVNANYVLHYREWVGMNFKEVLSLDDSFFFD